MPHFVPGPGGFLYMAEDTPTWTLVRMINCSGVDGTFDNSCLVEA